MQTQHEKSPKLQRISERTSHTSSFFSTVGIQSARIARAIISEHRAMLSPCPPASPSLLSFSPSLRRKNALSWVRYLLGCACWDVPIGVCLLGCAFWNFPLGMRLLGCAGGDAGWDVLARMCRLRFSCWDVPVGMYLSGRACWEVGKRDWRKLLPTPVLILLYQPQSWVMAEIGTIFEAIHTESMTTLRDKCGVDVWMPRCGTMAPSARGSNCRWTVAHDSTELPVQHWDQLRG